MLYILDETTTVGQFIAELEHFLSFKRSVADNAEELPTKSMLLEYTTKTVGRFEKVFSAPVSKALRKAWSDEVMKDSIVVDFWGYTMLDVRASDDCISLVSWMGETPVPLLTLALTCERVEEREYVRHIVLKEGDEPATPLSDIMARTALLQDTRAPIQDRWLEAPESFRTQHLICPICHSSFLELFRDGDLGEKPGHFECHHCGWSSKGKFYYRSELAEAKAYHKELKFIRQVEDVRTTLHRAEESLEAGLERVTLAYRLANATGGPSWEAKDLVDKYIKLLTDVQQKWASAEKNRQKGRKR